MEHLLDIKEHLHFKKSTIVMASWTQKCVGTSKRRFYLGNISVLLEMQLHQYFTETSHDNLIPEAYESGSRAICSAAGTSSVLKRQANLHHSCCCIPW